MSLENKLETAISEAVDRATAEKLYIEALSKQLTGDENDILGDRVTSSIKEAWNQNISRFHVALKKAAEEVREAIPRGTFVAPELPVIIDCASLHDENKLRALIALANADKNLSCVTITLRYHGCSGGLATVTGEVF